MAIERFREPGLPKTVIVSYEFDRTTICKELNGASWPEGAAFDQSHEAAPDA